MRKTLLCGALGLVLVAPADAEVGVSVRLGEPGFYGAIDIGDFPSPRLIYGEPRIITPGDHRGRPLYLHVPPGHAKHWDKHCHEYNACAHPAYFVEERWYNDTYAPRYRERHAQEGTRHGRGDDKGDGQGGGHGHGKGSSPGQGKGPRD